MDSFDRAILSLIQADVSLPLNEIAGRVGLSPTPCWNRIRKMEEAGIIAQRVAVLDAARLGLGVTIFVSIETADHSEEWLRAFGAGVSAMPEVMELYRMAGDVDYMLRVMVADMAAYDAFYKRLIEAFPLKNVSSRFAMERVKSTTVLAIPPEQAAAS